MHTDEHPHVDFETILALLDRLFTSGHSSLKFIGTIERRRFVSSCTWLAYFSLYLVSVAA